MFAAMSKFDDNPSREERLAAKLRENLLRRKAQGRARRRNVPATAADTPGGGLSKSEEDG